MGLFGNSLIGIQSRLQDTHCIECGGYIVSFGIRERIPAAKFSSDFSSSILALNVAIDTYLYTGTLRQLLLEPVLTPLNFFKVNVLDAVSLVYGVHSWHWYISQGIPAIMTTMLPLVLLGLFSKNNTTAARTQKQILKSLIVWVVFVYSLLSHKEFRFLFPLMPIFCVFASAGLTELPSAWRKKTLVALILTQIPMALYLSLWHQRGVVDVMHWIRSRQETGSLSVGILMPCHSTPWQSLVHRQDASMWFLTCEPPLTGHEQEYMDEADLFYNDPVLFLTRNMGTVKPWPEYLVLFDSLAAMKGSTATGNTTTVGHVIDSAGYQECERFFNSHFHDDWRRRGDVVVYCRQRPS